MLLLGAGSGDVLGGASKSQTSAVRLGLGRRNNAGSDRWVDTRGVCHILGRGNAIAVLLHNHLQHIVSMWNCKTYRKANDTMYGAVTSRLSSPLCLV